MRFMSYLLIVLGVTLMVFPFGELIWLWLKTRGQSGNRDTYYVVTFDRTAIAYFLLAVASLTGGLWLRFR